jgi:hypothetical protein
MNRLINHGQAIRSTAAFLLVTHRIDQSSLRFNELRDPALHRMAAIIRGADLPHEDDSPPEWPGVLAIFDGLRDGLATDEERMDRGFVVCDAIYACCRGQAQVPCGQSVSLTPTLSFTARS